MSLVYPTELQEAQSPAVIDALTFVTGGPLPSDTVGATAYHAYSRVGDHQSGDNVPFWRTWFEHAVIRAQSRLVAQTTSMGCNILDTLRNYVIGSGFTYACEPKNKVDENLSSAIQVDIDEFIDLNEWTSGGLEGEIHDRTREDGEDFIALFKTNRGVEVRLIGAEHVVDPTGVEREMERALGYTKYPSCWKYGVHTQERDIQRPIGYFVQWNTTGTDFDYFPATDWELARKAKTFALMHHIKRNVRRNVKRGVSDYFAVNSQIVNDAKLVRNVVAGAANQAAIAWIEEYETATSDMLTSNVEAASDSKNMVNTATGSVRNVFQKKLEPGTVIKMTAGKQYKPGPMGAERNAGFELVSQLSARRIAIRWNMPEYMISSDASNNNRASGVIAEGSFTKAREKDQRDYVEAFSAVFWKMLSIHVVSGRYAKFGVRTIEDLKKRINLVVTPPEVASRNKLEDAQAKEIMADKGVLSRETWRAEADLDPEVEDRNFKEEQPVQESTRKAVQRLLWDDIGVKAESYP